MSTVQTLNISESSMETPHADSIREVMSVSRLLTPPTTTEVLIHQDAKPTAISIEADESSISHHHEDIPMSKAHDCIESSDSPDVVKIVPPHREFICINDEYSQCVTGQYTKVLSRKVISHHFGRNKACTRGITNWPLFCRKHYQRATYDHHQWQLRKVNLILRQFDIIDSEYPGTKYDVVFKKSEERRLNEFSRKVASGMEVSDATAAVAPNAGKHFEAPIEVLRELELCIGRSKTIEEVKEAVNIILDMLHKEETKEVPAIEFLPQLPKKISASSTKSAKTGASSKHSSSAKGASSRISSKGGIKKTRRE